MTPRLLATLAAAAFVLAPFVARAQVPSFAIDQVYSNADGSVQFVVLGETQGQDGQTAFAGLTLRSTGGIPPRQPACWTKLWVCSSRPRLPRAILCPKNSLGF